MGTLEPTVDLICMCLGCGRKLACPEENHVDTVKLQTEKL